MKERTEEKRKKKYLNVPSMSCVKLYIREGLESVKGGVKNKWKNKKEEIKDKTKIIITVYCDRGMS